MDPSYQPGVPGPNPRLCDFCQQWDALDYYAFSPEQPRRLVDVWRNQQCLLCRNLTLALSSRPRDLDSACYGWQHSPQTHVVVNGPYLWDAGANSPCRELRRANHHPPSGSGHHDEGDDDIVVHVLFQVRVSFHELEDPHKLIAELQLASGLTPHFSTWRRLDENKVLRLVDMKPWEVPYANVRTMRKWIRESNEIHSSSSEVAGQGTWSAPNQLPPGAKLIDLKRLAVLDAPRNVRFVALSYMWPTSGQDHDVRLELGNMDVLSSPGGLETMQLPPIISDAINLAKQLGEVYMWIDRFCIVQDDPVSKQAQIDAMDRVYASAAFTIVAALDIRDGSLLPGVGRPRVSHWAWPAHDVEVEGAGIKPNVMNFVDSSVWNRRGWTFQERLLSRARLFITDLYVAYECAGRTWYEEHSYYLSSDDNDDDDVHAITRPRPPTSKVAPPTSIQDNKSEEEQIAGLESEQPETPDPQLIISQDVPEPSLLYWRWAADYNMRQLQYDTDVLNAFAGVGDYLGRVLDCRFVFNLPEKYLTHAMLWQASGSPKRRQEVPYIPSWSWAAWKNRIEFYLPEGSSSSGESRTPNLDTMVSLVRFHIVDKDAGLRLVNVEERWLNQVMSLTDFGCRETVPETTLKYHPNHYISHTVWTFLCPHTPWTMLERLEIDKRILHQAASFPGALVFNTTVAKLSIRHDGHDEGPGIFASTGLLVGRLPNLSREIYETSGNALFEFIVVCGGLESFRGRRVLRRLRLLATGTDGAEDVHMKSYLSWRLFVLLVRREDGSSNVYRRVHAGYIYAARWKACEPQWKTTILV